MAFFFPPNSFTNKPIIMILTAPISAGKNLRPNTVFPKIDVANLPMIAIEGGTET